MEKMKVIYSVFLSIMCLFLIEHNLEIDCSPTLTPTEDDTLVLVHVLFRHGNRTPNGVEELYPTDPYLNETYFPVGLGQLTNAGKRREFSIGKRLRYRYNTFLGPYYYPEIVESLSTDYNRTKMSLELVLAGLFPPRGEEIWNFWLNWQPVPYNYVPRDKDKVLYGHVCPRFLKDMEEYVQSEKGQSEIAEYKDVFNYIGNNSGLNITKFQDLYNLYFGVSTEEEWGFVLPEWTKKVWPKTITELAIKQYYVETATTELRQMAAGYFIEKILQETFSKINNTNSGRKIHLYSAHESNIASFLITLGIFGEPHIPNYGAHVILELHKINNKYGFKIFYENYEETKPKLLKIPACDSFCEIEQFSSLVQEYIPDPNLCFEV